MSVEHEAVKGLMGWAKGQPFNNVMCVLQLVLLGGLGWYALNVMVPEERKAILEGAQKIEDHHTQQVKSISDTYEKMLDRVVPERGDKSSQTTGGP